MRHLNTDELLAAIEQAEAGPAPGDLDNAPLIDNWFLVWRDQDTIRADGELSGHPEISAPWVTTSPVLGCRYDFEREVGWLRSRSRWYRLGRLRAVRIPNGTPKATLKTAIEAAMVILDAHRRAWRETIKTSGTTDVGSKPASSPRDGTAHSVLAPIRGPFL